MDSKPEHEKATASTDQGLAEFVIEHRKELETWVRRAGISAADAPDVVQDAWLTAANQLERNLFRHASLIGTWFRIILGGKIIDHKRSAHQRHFGRAVSIGPPEIQTVPAGDIQNQTEAYIAVHQALLNLPARERFLLALKYIEGFTVPEIAEQLGWNVRQVERVLQQAREQFRQVFLGGKT